MKYIWTPTSSMQTEATNHEFQMVPEAERKQRLLSSQFQKQLAPWQPPQGREGCAYTTPPHRWPPSQRMCPAVQEPSLLGLRLLQSEWRTLCPMLAWTYLFSLSVLLRWLCPRPAGPLCSTIWPTRLATWLNTVHLGCCLFGGQFL